METLTHLQKNILIFLLLVVIMVMAILIASYCIWKRSCGRDLKRALEARQNAEDPTEPVEDTYFVHRTPQPSVPFMSSFSRDLENSNSANTSTVSISTSAGQGSDLERNQGSYLPSYNSVMRQRE